MVHRPLTASNLLDTWRRCHGDAKITCGSYWDHETGAWKPLDGARWGSKFLPRAVLCEDAAENICLRERKNQSGMKGEKRHRDVFRSFPFFLVIAENIPSLAHIPPVQMLWYLKLYMHVECFCRGLAFTGVFVCMCSGRFVLCGCLRRFSERLIEATVLNL